MTLPRGLEDRGRGRVGGRRESADQVRQRQRVPRRRRPRAARARHARLLDRPAARGDVPLCPCRADLDAPTRSPRSQSRARILCGTSRAADGCRASTCRARARPRAALRRRRGGDRERLSGGAACSTGLGAALAGRRVRRHDRARRRRGDPPAPRRRRAPRATVDRSTRAARGPSCERQVELRPAARRARGRCAGWPAAATRAAARPLRGRARPPGLRNVVGRLPGAQARGGRSRAHYDSEGAARLRRGQRRRRPARRRSSSWRARCARPAPGGAPELRFVLFDGEEATDDGAAFAATGLRGSTRLRRAPRAASVGALILLDFVADEDLRLPREAKSDRGLWPRAARRRDGGRRRHGVPATARRRDPDDHEPFLRAAIPAIDLDRRSPCGAGTRRCCDDLVGGRASGFARRCTARRVVGSSFTHRAGSARRSREAPARRPARLLRRRRPRRPDRRARARALARRSTCARRSSTTSTWSRSSRARRDLRRRARGRRSPRAP